MGCCVVAGWACVAYYGADQAAGRGMTLSLDIGIICGKIPNTKNKKRIYKKDIRMSFRATVESMSKIMDEMGITELDLERQFLFGVYRKHIHLSKQQVAATVAMPSFSTADAKHTTSEPAEKVSGYALKSPMVGVVYLAPEPGAKAFTTVGASIKAGDTVALVEAMKTFNPIKSDKDGVVKEILVTDGQAVEFDQPLIVIE